MSVVTCGTVCQTLESEVSLAINEAQHQRVVLHPKQGFPKAPLRVRRPGQSWEKRGDLCDLSRRIIRQGCSESELDLSTAQLHYIQFQTLDPDEGRSRIVRIQ